MVCEIYMTEIVERLYVGSARALSEAEKYDLVVNCTVNVPASEKYMKTIRVPVEDLPEENNAFLFHMEIRGVLEAMHECLQEPKHYVLVHCNAGRQRSCRLIACYLIRYHRMTAVEAALHIKNKHREAFFGGMNFSEMINKFYENERKMLDC